MTKPFRILLLFLLFISTISYSQKKRLNALASGNINIDGKLDEEIWQFAPIASDFFMYYPDNGKLVGQDKKTEVQVVYNDNGVFIAAKLFDNEPSKMLDEITQRDNVGSSELFGVFINGFNDSQQDFRFYVSLSGVQTDCVFTNQNGEDLSWDAIWISETQKTDFGWVVEMEIPYAALRFPKNKIQTWGINFFRENRRDRQYMTWNPIDLNIPNDSAQSGILTGIEDVETPTRLFLIPYSSFYLNSSEYEKTRGELKGGLDIKYGLNDAFTLDAILVPDFGQTKYDDIILNLGPFEQQFTENRPFFTESTDLFQKGNIFYSRRIGENLASIETAPNETIEDFPNSIKLINALKISGRNKSGLGIGVLNAVSEKTSVTVRNTDTNQTKTALLEPLANYNVFVLDQRFRQNSSVSFVNTNVLKNGAYKDANVSAFVYDLNTKANSYNLKGDFKYSYINQTGNADNKTGFNTSMSIGETIGKFRYSLYGQYVSKDFDNNDLGIIYQTHFYSLNGNINYRILNPNKYFNSFNAKIESINEFENKTGKVQTSLIKLSFNTITLKNNEIGYGFVISPTKTYDFYEPRSFDESKYVIVPESFKLYGYYTSNFNHKFALDIYPQVIKLNEKNRINYRLSFSPRYRFNDHFSLIYSFEIFKQVNNIGSAQDYDNLSVFTRRNVISYNNNLQGKYAINNKMNFNLSVRHYWAYATSNKFLTLENDGNLTENTTYTNNVDSNFNAWNLDLSYNWWFAPGSQVSVLYRNFNLNTETYGSDFSKSLGRNLSDSFNNDNLNHIFSISVRYFIDYNTLKK